MRGSLEERFWQFVSPEPNSGCWLWTGATYCAPWAKNTGGYGKIGHNNKVLNAHAVSYRMHKGEIPEGMEIDHKCRVTCCVNPDHLEAVPHRVNMLRGTGPIARQAKQTHCKRGHEFTPKTTYL